MQCAKRDEAKTELRNRQKLNVDPFNQEFHHASNLSNLSLHSVRLCFQVIAMPPQILMPVVSDIIQNEKTSDTFSILHFSSSF